MVGRFWVLHKPSGVENTMHSSKSGDLAHVRAEEACGDLRPFLRGLPPGVFPVGRLDMDTSGLLLLTDDGDACCRLLWPGSHVEKEYELCLEHQRLFFERFGGGKRRPSCPVHDPRLRALREGVMLEDGRGVARAREVRVVHGTPCLCAELTVAMEGGEVAALRESRLARRKERRQRKEEVQRRKRSFAERQYRGDRPGTGAEKEKEEEEEEEEEKKGEQGKDEEDSGDKKEKGQGWSGVDWRVRMVLTEGRNRQVRKMCWKAGLTLLHLHRVRIGNVELGDLSCGELRELSSEEVEGLYRCLDEAEREQVPCGEGEEGQEGKEEGGHSADKAASCFFFW